MDPSEYPASKYVLSEERKAHLRDGLVAAGANTPCGRCGAPFDQIGMVPSQSSFMLFELSEALQGVQEQLLPVVILLCTRCGALYPHAAGLLEKKGQHDTP